MKITNKDLSIEFRDYGVLNIPKGTRVTSHTACGHDEAYNFIDDLSWVPKHDNGVEQYGLLHDLTYYGLNIDRQHVECV